MRIKTSLLIGAVAFTAFVSCKNETAEVTTLSGLNPANFQTEVNGKQTDLYTLTNANGMEVCVTNFGGRIVSVMVPDRDGNMVDVVLGFDSIQDYINVPSDFGAAIGRYANRINRGSYVLDGDTIKLPTNNVDDPENEGKFLHTLHGGPTGWQYQVYDVKEVNDSSITLVMNSADGDNGFPGNVVAEVTYTLTPDNAIDIAYKATTDAPTVINLTNHSYFNLNGDPDMPITNCIMMVNANEFSPIDTTFIPLDDALAVSGTPFDFIEPRAIGDSIASEYQQVVNGNGYDHNWILATEGNDEVVAATVVSPATGICLEVLTDEPGVQIYTGNFLDGSVTGKNGKTYQQRAAVCLETQHYPDSPNHPEWPSVVLRPGEEYTSHCIYRFSVTE